MRWTTAPRSASSSSRGEQVTPQQAGLPNVGSRRVPGLRRGEVATLTGVSVEYYAKLERRVLRQARTRGAGRRVRHHPRRDRPGPPARRGRTGPPFRPRPGRRRHQRADAGPVAHDEAVDITTGPAIVRNGRIDLLATNHLGRAMHSSLYASDPAGRRTWPALCPPRPVRTKQSAEMTPMRLAPDQGKL
jgi:hypothetical protein